MKTYVTFGQTHIHKIDGKVFDEDCVAVIHADSVGEGRKIAMDIFKGQFCTTYLDKIDLSPRVFIELN